MLQAFGTYGRRILRWIGRYGRYDTPANSRSQLAIEAAQLRAAFENGSATDGDVSRWIGNDPERIIAYERIAAWSGRLDRLSVLRPQGNVGIDPDLFAPKAPGWHLPSFFLGRPVLGGSMALAAVAAISLAVFLPAYLAEVTTGVGERRLIALEDGSTIELNTSSIVSVNFKDTAREVTLRSGEAMFNVAKDSSRPFHVLTNGRAITAVGTAFSVRRWEGDETHVVVSEGTVVVSPLSGALIDNKVAQDKDRTYLVAGSLAKFKEGEADVTRLSTQELAGRLAWRSGFISFDGEPLSAAIEEFNRYQRHSIVVANDIRSIRIGGYFKVSDREGFIRALTLTFGIEPVRLADGAVLLQRVAPATYSASPATPTNRARSQ